MVAVEAANATQGEYRLELSFPGDWYDDESEMLKSGFVMRVLT